MCVTGEGRGGSSRDSGSGWSRGVLGTERGRSGLKRGAARRSSPSPSAGDKHEQTAMSDGVLRSCINTTHPIWRT